MSEADDELQGHSRVLLSMLVPQIDRGGKDASGLPTERMRTLFAIGYVVGSVIAITNARPVGEMGQAKLQMLILNFLFGQSAVEIERMLRFKDFRNDEILKGIIAGSAEFDAWIHTDGKRTPIGLMQWLNNA